MGGYTAGRFTIAKRSEKQNEMRGVGSEHSIDVGELKTASKKDWSLSKPKHIVVAWYEDNVGSLLTSLAGFAPANSTVTLVSKEKPEVS